MEEKFETQKQILRPVRPKLPEWPWKVNHAEIEVRVGDVVEFDPCGEPAQVWIPVADIFGTMLIELPGEPRSFRVEGGEEGKSYPYGFYLREQNVLLEGDSPPRIRLRK